jgi:hypothetical protein
MREREKEIDALMSRSPVANTKSDPHYSVFITIFVYQFYIPRKMFLCVPLRFAYTRLKTAVLHDLNGDFLNLIPTIKVK